jgi:hypothetical protein
MMTAGTLEMVRKQRNLTLSHTYTWIQRVGSTVDSEGGSEPVWGLPVTNRPCHLLPQSIVRIDPSGAPLEMQAPRLIVAWNDAIAEGDAVEVVADAYGNVLLVGPAAVMNVTEQVAAEAATHKVCQLSFEAPQPQPVLP